MLSFSQTISRSLHTNFAPLKNKSDSRVLINCKIHFSQSQMPIDVMSYIVNHFFMAGVTFMCLSILVWGSMESKILHEDTRLPEYEYHLVTCFENIITSYFDNERTMLLSLPEVCGDHYNATHSEPTSRSYCKVIDFLFVSIQNRENHPLLVTGPAFNGTFKGVLPSEKGTVFNIILGNGDDDTVFNAFKSDLARISHLPFWNARGKFIIMSLSRNLSSVNFVPEENKLIKNVLGELWEKDVVNAIVLAHNIDTNTSTATVDIHTWFPFAEDHCRGPVERTVILDQWLIDGESGFVKNAKLFPDKMLNFFKCVVKASTFPHEPFIIFNRTEASNITRYSEGIEISVLQIIGSELNFTIQYLPEPQRKVNKIFSLYSEVSNKQSDIGFASSPRTYQTIGTRDYTIGYIRESIKWFGPLAKRSPRWKGLVIIFAPLMWLLVLTVYLIASLVFWLLANVNRRKNEHVSYKNAVLCFLQMFSVILGEAVFVTPHSWSLRLFFIVCVFYCLLINTSYQSSLISVLTHPQFEPAIDTVEELLKSKMAHGFVPFLRHWLNETNDAESREILRNYVNCSTLQSCLKRVVYKQDLAVCGGELHLLCLSYKKKYRISGGPKFVPFKDEVATFLASMFFRSGSPFLENFDRIIYRVVESGMVQKFWEDLEVFYRFGQIDEEGDEFDDENTDGHVSEAVVLTVDHLQGAFFLLLLGLAFSLTVFIIELFCFIFRHYLFFQSFHHCVTELKTRSFVNYKRHIIHRTFARSVNKRSLTGKLKMSS